MALRNILLTLRREKEIMNREIKFRGKGLGNEQWVYGHYGVTMHGKHYIDCVESSISMSHNIVIPETVGQFTGAYDAEINGKEVFEGDVIQNCDNDLLQEVYYDEDRFAWYCRYLYDNRRIVSLRESIGNLNKVVSNIHDNPELLK